MMRVRSVAIAIVSVLALAPALAIELPDQLTTDFPGRGPTLSGERPSGPGGPGMGSFGGDSHDPWSEVSGAGEQVASEGSGYSSGTTSGAGGGSFYSGSSGSSGLSGSGSSSSGPTRAQGLRDKLQISGRLSANLRGSSVDGNSTAYSQQFSDTSDFDQTGSITMNGRIWSAIPLYIRASANVRPYAPTRLDWTLIWHERSFDVTYGDIQPHLTRNAFASLSRRTKGVTVAGDIGRDGTYELFGAETKGITRTDTIPGEGTAGPYYLRYTPVREETVRVRIDEEDVSRSRYRLEPESGRLTFDESLIVLQTSVISVVYEENRTGEARGLYLGGAVDYRLGSLPLSLTYIRQDISGSGSSTGDSVSREEEFIPNSTTGPFSLSYRPIDTSRPIVAYVDGVEFEQGRDFELNATTGVIQFFNIVPATSTLRIAYYSLTTEQQSDTAKELYGFDTGYRFGNLRTTFSGARSQGGLLSDGTPAGGGNAWRLGASWTGLGRKLDVTGSYRQQDAGFSRIETASFDRDESGWDMSARYRPTRSITTYAKLSRMRSRTGLSLGAGDGSGSTTTGLGYLTSQDSAGANWRYGSGEASVALSSSSSGNDTSGNTSRESTNVQWSHRLGSADVSAQWSRTGRSSIRPSSDETEDGWTRTRTRTDSLRFGAGYRWGGGNRVSASWSDAQTQDLAGGSLGSRVTTLSGDLTWQPTDAITFTARKSLSDSSGATYLSASTVSAASSGWALWQQLHALQTSSDLEIVDARVLDDSTSLSLSYRPGGSFDIGLNAREERYESSGGVGYMSDQLRRTYSLDAGWDAGTSLRTDLHWTVSETTYLQRVRGRVWNQGWGASVDWRPSRTVSLTAGYDRTGSLSPSYRGGTDTDTGFTTVTSSAYDNAFVRADWSLGGRNGRLSADWELTRNRGDYDQSDRQNLSLSYFRPITDDVSLELGGRWVDFRDLTVAADVPANRGYRALTYFARVSVGF